MRAHYGYSEPRIQTAAMSAPVKDVLVVGFGAIGSICVIRSTIAIPLLAHSLAHQTLTFLNEAV